jgi:hypothetical protein
MVRKTKTSSAVSVVHRRDARPHDANSTIWSCDPNVSDTHNGPCREQYPRSIRSPLVAHQRGLQSQGLTLVGVIGDNDVIWDSQSNTLADPGKYGLFFLIDMTVKYLETPEK